VNLLEGLSACSVLEINGPTQLDIRQIVTDSRKVETGSIFVALPGTKQDGRAFIGEAISRGAAAIVFEEGFSGGAAWKPRPEAPHVDYKAVTRVCVRDAHEALFHLAASFFGNSMKDLRFVGVTGTNGKTTTTFLIQSLFQTAGRKTGLIGTIHYDLGGVDGRNERTRQIVSDRREGVVSQSKEESFLGDVGSTATNGSRLLSGASGTTPGILDLQRLFAQMKKNGVTDIVMEASSHGLDQRRTFGLSFDTAVFTNLTRDHLDYHKTMEAYFEAKKRLFHQTTGTSVINIDDPWGRKLKSDLSGRTLCYGIQHHEEIYPKEISYTLSGIKMTVETPIGEIAVSSELVGQHNVYNLLGAIGVGVASGLGRDTIAAGIARMKSVPGRFEKIDLGQDFLVIVDYAHTEDALARLLQSVSSLSLGHVITVVGCGGDRDRGKRPKMGEVASLYSRLAILTSDNPRSESPQSIIGEIEAGILDKNPTAFYKVIPDRKEAIFHAISCAAAGDSVVIAGKGHETGQIVGGTVFPFDDRAVARQALYETLGTRRN